MFDRVLNMPLQSLKGQCQGSDIMLVTSFACDNWFCHIWRHNDKLYPKYQKNIVSSTMVVPPHKDTLLHNTFTREQYFKFFWTKPFLINTSFTIEKQSVP